MRKRSRRRDIDAYLLRTLLLGKHFILLRDDFCFVLEDEGKGEPNE